LTSPLVIDTNVTIVANGQAEQAPLDCVSACIVALQDARHKRPVLIDDLGLILDEYRRYLSFAGQPGPGDSFFKWLWDNQANELYCRAVTITAQDEREFLEFPDDPDLAGFDRSDRKFVAVAIASAAFPVVLNASDTRSWGTYQEPLAKHSVRIEFLCPELMKERG